MLSGKLKKIMSWLQNFQRLILNYLIQLEVNLLIYFEAHM